MIVIPAIDIKGGKVVRLEQGRFEKTTVYSDNPNDIASRFVDDGAERIHIVDLEGALTGKPKAGSIIREIVKNRTVSFQVGGGVRDPKVIEYYLNAGVSRVVCGTRACLDKGFLKEALKSFGSSVIIGVDASKGFLATDGWTKITSIRTDQMIERVIELGGEEVIYTDISKDGMLTGPNIQEIKRITGLYDVNIIASGGVSTLSDISTLKSVDSERLIGVIVGKALMEGKFTLKEAIKSC